MNMKINRSSNRVVALLTLLAPIAWGTTYVTITELLGGRPAYIAAMRVLPAGVLLAGLGVISSRWRPRGEQWWQQTVLALFNFALFFPFLIAAIGRLPGGVVASVGGTQPILVMLISRVVAGTVIGRRDLLIGAVAAIGVGLVVMRPGASVDPLGVAFALIAVISFSIGIVLTKVFHPPERRLAATGWQLLLSSLLIVPLAAFTEGRPPPQTTINLIGFFYLGLVATGLAFAVWFSGVSQLPVAAPPLLALAAPITGASLGWIVLGESLAPLQILGFAVTIAAIVYGGTVASVPPSSRSQSPGRC